MNDNQTQTVTRAVTTTDVDSNSTLDEAPPKNKKTKAKPKAKAKEKPEPKLKAKAKPKAKKGFDPKVVKENVALVRTADLPLDVSILESKSNEKDMLQPVSSQVDSDDTETYLTEEGTPTDSVISLLFSILEEKFQVVFTSLHYLSVNYMLHDFFFASENHEFFGLINYEPNMFPYYTRNRSAQLKKIEHKIETNATFKPIKGEKPLTFSELKELLQTKLKPFDEKFLSYFKNMTNQSRIDEGYHTLQSNYIWFFDFTQVEHFGDGFNKNTGPYLLFIMDCASRFVLHWYLVPFDEQVNSKLILKQLDRAIEKEDSVPTILHSDSDFKNRSYNMSSALFERRIFPSLNKNIFGETTTPHGNQVIEAFNRKFKGLIDKHMQTNNLQPGHFEKYSIKDLNTFVGGLINDYHKTPHRHLSPIVLDKDAMPVSPNEAYTSHRMFSVIQAQYNVLKNMEVVPESHKEIENLDLSVEADLVKFIEYVVNFVMQNPTTSNDEEVLNLFKTNKDGAYEDAADYFQLIQYVCYHFYTYAVKSAEDGNAKLLLRFFDNSYPPTTKGPTRQNVFSDIFIDQLKTKEAMAKAYPMLLHIQITITQNLLYSSFKQNKALLVQQILLHEQSKDIKAEIRAVADLQTSEIKEHSERVNKQTQDKLVDVTTALHDLEQQYEKASEDLAFFVDKERKRTELREKRKNRNKKKPTQPIDVEHFFACLELTKSNSNDSLAKKFANARDRVSNFILFFSGRRISTLIHISFQQLAITFSQDLSSLAVKTFKEDKPELARAEFPVSKKRDKKEQHVFTVAKKIRNDFIYGQYNLQEDFLFLANHVSNWAKERDIPIQTWADYSFYTTYQTPDKPISRVNLTNNINSIVRSSVKDVEPNVSNNKIKTFSSRSFRVNAATNYIYLHGIRQAQQYLHHSSIATTAIYDSNTLPIKQMEQMSLQFLTPRSETKKPELRERLNELSSELADAKSFSEKEIQELEAASEAFDLEEAKNDLFTFKRQAEHVNKARAKGKKEIKLKTAAKKRLAAKAKAKIKEKSDEKEASS